jgi:hypothetical protein
MFRGLWRGRDGFASPSDMSRALSRHLKGDKSSVHIFRTGPGKKGRNQVDLQGNGWPVGLPKPEDHTRYPRIITLGWPPAGLIRQAGGKTTRQHTLNTRAHARNISSLSLLLMLGAPPTVAGIICGDFAACFPGTVLLGASGVHAGLAPQSPHGPRPGWVWRCIRERRHRASRVRREMVPPSPCGGIRAGEEDSR